MVKNLESACVLAVIANHDDGLSLAELCEQLPNAFFGEDRSSVRRKVEGLHEKGLVLMKVMRRDNRKRIYKASASGMRESVRIAKLAELMV